MGNSCKDCKGSGKYQVLMTVSDCSRCNGTGIEPSGPPAAVYSGEVISEERARKIMGAKMLGVLDARLYFGLNDTFTDTLSAGIPCSEGFLRDSRDRGMILVADGGISVIDIRSAVSAHQPPLFFDQEWYDAEDFALKTVAPAWRLLSAEAFPGSFGMDWPAQQGMVSQSGLVIPEAREVAYAAIGMFLATGVRLFEDCYVRTSSTDSDGNPVSLGYFVGDGLFVSSVGDDGFGVGVASAACPFRSSK